MKVSEIRVIVLVLVLKFNEDLTRHESEVFVIRKPFMHLEVGCVIMIAADEHELYNVLSYKFVDLSLITTFKYSYEHSDCIVVRIIERESPHNHKLIYSMMNFVLDNSLHLVTANYALSSQKISLAATFKVQRVLVEFGYIYPKH